MIFQHKMNLWYIYSAEMPSLDAACEICLWMLWNLGILCVFFFLYKEMIPSAFHNNSLAFPNKFYAMFALCVTTPKTQSLWWGPITNQEINKNDGIDKWLWVWLSVGCKHAIPDSNVHGANMGPTWVLSAPDGPHVGPMNLAIRDIFKGSSAKLPHSVSRPQWVNVQTTVHAR